MVQKFGEIDLMFQKHKNVSTVILLLLISVAEVCAQYTPNCTNIATYVVPTIPLTPAQVASINLDQQSQFPNAVKLEEPTSSYNCHNYAFVKHDDDGPAFWLNSPGDDAFWLDGSYLVTTNTGEAGLRVSYQGDHSAVTTSKPFECISKWGAWGLYRHSTTYVPAIYLPHNPLTYYKKDATLAGPDALCASETYTVTNLPAGASIASWSAAPSYGVSFSGSGNSRTISRVGSFNGSVTITVAINTTCGTFNVRKSVHVGPSKPDFIDWTYNFPPGRTTLYTDPIFDATAYQWYVDGVLYTTTTVNSISIDNIELPCDVPIVFGVRAVTPCGVSSETYTWAEIPCFLMGFTVYPNPANETLTVAMGSETERSSVPDKAALPTFKAVLYDGAGKQLRQGESREGAVEFDTRQLPNGTYFLHIHHNNEVEKRQVVIRH